MSADVFTNRREFKLGRAVELVVSQFMQEHDWLVIPSYDYAGLDHDKPPRLQGVRSAFPIPDLDICRNGERRWLEVKAKRSARMYHNRGVYQHGIHNYKHYLEVQQQTGTPVWLGIVEYTTVDTPDERGEEGLLLMRRLDLLGKPQESKSWNGLIHFWPRDAFQPVYRFPDLRAAVTEMLAEPAAAA